MVLDYASMNECKIKYSTRLRKNWWKRRVCSFETMCVAVNNCDDIESYAGERKNDFFKCVMDFCPENVTWILPIFYVVFHNFYKYQKADNKSDALRNIVAIDLFHRFSKDNHSLSLIGNAKSVKKSYFKTFAIFMERFFVGRSLIMDFKRTNFPVELFCKHLCIVIIHFSNSFIINKRYKRLILLLLHKRSRYFFSIIQQKRLIFVQPGTNATISDQLLSDENNPDTDHSEMHEKSLPDLELLQNRNQHHRLMNSIQSIQR